MLTAIRFFHTMIWAILAGSIVALPVVGVRRFRWAAILTGLVVLECIVLAVNGGRCPLSDLAARFTDSHAYNFIKIHRTLRMSPAMAAGVSDRLWSVEDLVALWDAYEQRTSERAVA
jgi:hypothetical protein